MGVLNNAIYEAEEAAELGECVERVRDIQAFIAEVLGSDYWRERYRIQAVDLHLTWDNHNGAWRGRKTTYGEVHLWRPLTKMEILHELAHLPTWNGNSHRPDHGRDFIAVYVDLVSAFLGEKQALALKEEIIRRKVYGYRVLC